MTNGVTLILKKMVKDSNALFSYKNKKFSYRHKNPPENFIVFRGIVLLSIYSHSIVPIGLGVRS